MRTRFLTTDYFNTNQTLNFLRFPVPHLQRPPPDYLSSSLSSYFEHEHLRCLDSSSEPAILQLDEFPIEDALSKFLSDVLPHTIDVGDGVFPDSHRNYDTGGFLELPETIAGLAYEERATETAGTSGSEISNKLAEGRTEDTTCIGGKNDNGHVILRLEVPELSQDLENACMSEKEKFQLLSEVQECDDILENFNMGLPDSYHCDINDSIDTIKPRSPEYDMEEKTQMPEEFSSLLNNVRSCESMLPLFEVNELGIEDFRCACIEDEFYSYIVNIEVQHCTCNDDLEVNCQSLLVSVESDILELIDYHHTSKRPLDFDVESLNSAVDMDILKVIETPKRGTGIIEAYLFEELELLDPVSFEIFEAYPICRITEEPDICSQLFLKDTNFKTFDELIVMSELAVINDSFVSLPVPDVKDEKEALSLHVIVTDIFPKLEPVPLSTSDEIYLDWHLLGKGKCNDDVLTATEKVFNDVGNLPIDLSLNPNDGSMMVLDSLLSDDPLDCLNITEKKLNIPSGGSCSVKEDINTVKSSDLPDDDCHIIENSEMLNNAESVRVTSGKLSDEDCQIIEDTVLTHSFEKPAPSVEKMSHFSDLDFFLNPWKATSNMQINCRTKALNDTSVFFKGFEKRKAASPVQKQQLDVQLHTVSLPPNFIILIDNLRRSYLAVFSDDRKLNETGKSMANSNDINLLGLSVETLMEHLIMRTKQKSFVDGDENAVAFFMLCSIKRMAWCLCFYGIYTLRLFLRKLLQKLDCLKPRLSFLHSLIEDAYVQVDKETAKSHPSLAIFKEILKLSISRKSKVLILAHQFLWGGVKRLLSSMDIVCIEVENHSMRENQANFFYEFFEDVPRDPLKTACMLLSHEDVSPSILMQKFDIILEYGGPSDISKVSTFFSENIGARSLHFLKVELDGVAKALCEGVIDASTDISTIKLEDLLNFGSIMETRILASSEAVGRTSPCSMHRHVCHMPRESEPTQPKDLSFPNMLIVMNTKISDNDMLISRRSTYQKILTLENRGGQVVERDLTLPVDVVIDSTMCIVWYDCKNIAGKTTGQDENSSTIPICVENIAANVLTSLSFTFTTCVLIFEGEMNFLGSIMESGDELYAAATSLGMYLQIFCSYSPELTDEIILGSIGNAMKFSKGLLPRLPESETLAESFLTRFPSMNPLSAHAIISSGCTLLEFFELSPEDRSQVLKKYNVPDESIHLLSVLSKYGELEGSKSSLTDCSSSVSSPPESDQFFRKISSEDRKRKFVPSSSDHLHDFKFAMPSSTYIDDRLISRRISTSLESELSKGLTKRKFLDDEVIFGQGGLPDSATIKDPSKPWSRTNTGLLSDRFFGRQKFGTPVKIKQDEYDSEILEDQHEDLRGEVDIHGHFQAVEKAARSANNHAPKHNKTARRLSFGASSYPTFPSAEELNTNSQVNDDCMGVEYNWSNNGFKAQKEPTKKVSVPFSKDDGFSSYGETSLSKAINSEQVQQGSPWTIEFLNRIKEKRRLHQQRQPLGTSIPSSTSRQDYNRVTKIRSPSILDFYMYQRGSTSPSKVTKQKRQKQDNIHQQRQPLGTSIPSSTSRQDYNRVTKIRSPSILDFYKHQRGSTSPSKVTKQKRQKQDNIQPVHEKPSEFFATWTPTDKKANRPLSFARSGSGGQTKLVWKDNISNSHRSRFSDSQ